MSQNMLTGMRTFGKVLVWTHFTKALMSRHILYIHKVNNSRQRFDSSTSLVVVRVACVCAMFAGLRVGRRRVEVTQLTE